MGVEMNERSMVSGSLEPVTEAGVPGPSPSYWYLLMDSAWREAMKLLATGPGLALVGNGLWCQAYSRWESSLRLQIIPTPLLSEWKCSKVPK